MMMFTYVIPNYILKYIMCIIYIMSITKSCLRLLRMGDAGAKRMRRRATLPQPGGYMSMFQDSDPAPGQREADPAPPSPIAMAALPRLGFESGTCRHRRAPVSDPARSGVFWLSSRQ
jgi:hypothetical protein